MANYTVTTPTDSVTVRVAPGAGADAATKLAYLGRELHRIEIGISVVESLIRRVQLSGRQYAAELEAMRRER